VSPGHVLSEKRAKTKGRRNVWKDETGRSLFEMDETTPGQVALVGVEGISIPISALPTKAKFVVKQNQYSRRNETTEGDFEDENDEEEDLDEYMYKPQRRTNFGDFIGASGSVEATNVVPQSDPEYTKSPDKCLETAQSNLELFHLLEAEDPTKNHVLDNLRHLRTTLISFVQGENIEDNTMNKLITQLSALNEVLGEA